MGTLSHLLGAFPTQGVTLGILNCGWICYQLNHKGSPRILECLSYPISSSPSQARTHILHCRQILYQLSYQGSPSVPFSSVLSHVRLFVTPWTAAHQASMSITNSGSLFNLMFIESVLPPNHLILCHPLLLLPSVFPGSFPMSQFFSSGGQSIGASASVSPSNEYSGLISFRTDWFDLLAFQGTPKSLL